jgi:hypothetical protein
LLAALRTSTRRNQLYAESRMPRPTIDAPAWMLRRGDYRYGSVTELDGPGRRAGRPFRGPARSCRPRARSNAVGCRRRQS